jgi:hypothetical protein
LFGGIGLLAAASGIAWWRLRVPQYLWRWQRPSSGSAGIVAGKEPLKYVGVLNSLSGPLFDSGRPVIDATLLAIEELNSRGGVLGRPIEAIVADGKSDNATFRQRSRAPARRKEGAHDLRRLVTVEPSHAQEESSSSTRAC